MEKIEALTPKQEAKLDKYYEKWLKIGMKTGTSAKDRKEAEKCIFKIYKNRKLKKPKIIWTRSPHEAAMLALSKGDKKDNLVWSAGYGTHDASWLGFYDFMRTELKLKEETEELVPLIELAKFSGWWFPYENVCIASDRPQKLHVNADGAMHNFKGPAIKYGDGFCMYLFNGIEVSKELAETPAKDITKEMFLKETNADIRREVIRKIGLEQTIEMLGAEKVDTYDAGPDGKVELLMVDYDNTGKRPYIKVQCPSAKGFYILGSKPGTKTAKEAYEFLNNNVKQEKVETVWTA